MEAIKITVGSVILPQPGPFILGSFHMFKYFGNATPRIAFQALVNFRVSDALLRLESNYEYIFLDQCSKSTTWIRFNTQPILLGNGLSPLGTRQRMILLRKFNNHRREVNRALVRRASSHRKSKVYILVSPTILNSLSRCTQDLVMESKF